MYLELHTSSAFSFLDGASLPETLIERAAALGYPAIALLDRDGVYGAPQFYRAAKAAGIKAIVGAELTIGHPPAPQDLGTRNPELRDHGTSWNLREPKEPLGTPGNQRNSLRTSWTLPVLVASAEGYRNLCRLVTRAKLRAPKGEATLDLDDFTGHTAGLMALVGCVGARCQRHGVGGLVDRARRVVRPPPCLD